MSHRIVIVIVAHSTENQSQRAPLSSRPVNTTTSSSMSRLTKPTASSAAASAQTLTAKRKRDELAAAAPRAATSSTASRVAAARYDRPRPRLSILASDNLDLDVVVG